MRNCFRSSHDINDCDPENTAFRIPAPKQAEHPLQPMARIIVLHLRKP